MEWGTGGLHMDFCVAAGMAAQGLDIGFGQATWHAFIDSWSKN